MSKRKYKDTPLLAEKMKYGQAANFIGVSERTLKSWVNRGEVPHYRIGRRVYFVDKQLLDWVESCRRGENG